MGDEGGDRAIPTFGGESMGSRTVRNGPYCERPEGKAGVGFCEKHCVVWNHKQRRLEALKCATEAIQFGV